MRIRRALLMVAVLAAVSLAASGVASVAPPPSPAADWVGDPNLMGNLMSWERFDPGNAASTDGISVSTQPNGATSPGIVRVIDDPLGRQGKVYEETVTPTAHASTSSNSDATYLFNYPKSYLGSNGQSDWIHFKMMFPSGYRPTVGEWNVFNEFHNDSNYIQWYNQGVISWEYPEIVLYVTNYVGGQPHLMYRVRGGVDGKQGMSVGTDITAPRQLQTNHWYDIVLHIVWSPHRTVGTFEWWLDGTLVRSIKRPTLWQRPDGSTDHVEFELNNYRQHATWNATVYYSKVKIGSSQASVGSSLCRRSQGKPSQAWINPESRHTRRSPCRSPGTRGVRDGQYDRPTPR